MKRRDFLRFALISGAIAGTNSPLLAKPQFLPQVLLLGDSISIGYWPFVTRLLEREAEVYRPMRNAEQAENCEGTSKGKTEIARWLGEKQWDLIHFNFGLHDLKHVDPQTGKNSQNPADPRQAEPEVYRENLTEIVQQLKASGAKLLFATTTPYPKNVEGPVRAFRDERKYNRIAKRIMKQHDIPVNDLHRFVLPRMEELQKPQNVHFHAQGSEMIAEEVVRVMSRYLS